jgi:RNA 2',3'-cyclic 3'-phosphodiesterase
MSQTLRLFVAAYPPESAARAMLRALAKLDPPPDPRHRVVPLEQVHLTVQFIGPAQERELPEISESIERSASGVAPFVLMPLRLATFPRRPPPRLIAMETDGPAGLLELQRRLAQRLARKPRPKTGDRFRPHFTLCRFTGSARPAPLDEPVLLEPFRIGEVLLMRSELLPAGARHVEVARVELG